MNDRAWLKAHGLTARLMTLMKPGMWGKWMDGDKLVTRRGGPHPAWAAARSGSLVETVEWSPRVGARWTCMACGWLGSTKLEASPRMELRAGDPDMLTAMLTAMRMLNHAWNCFCGTDADEETMGETLKRVLYRPPRRGGLAVIVSTRVERLGDITRPELALEGFPGMDVINFVALYSGHEHGSRAWNLATNWKVTRLELAPLDLDGGETRSVRAGPHQGRYALGLVKELRHG